ncbi:Gp49 family protein [Mannheimia haemolytica]|uniref:Gp49 family protein n=1 Tax=Mannheimia haemolytica TaxID=75985 RepID=UPI0031452985
MVLTLKNGYKVTGESACLDVANFDVEIGESVAHAKAVSKIWELEGYLLAQKRYEEVKNAKG